MMPREEKCSGWSHSSSSFLQVQQQKLTFNLFILYFDLNTFSKNTSKYFSLKTWFYRRYDVLNHYEFQMENIIYEDRSILDLYQIISLISKSIQNIFIFIMSDILSFFLWGPAETESLMEVVTMKAIWFIRYARRNLTL